MAKKILIKAIVVLAIISIALFSYLAYAQNIQKKVLVFNSYHPCFAWSDGIMDGIKSVLKAEENIEIDIVYMDTKRINDKEHYKNLYELYKHQFKDRDYDLILTSDDNAFNFIIQYHDELFPDKPVVFTGLNSLSVEQEKEIMSLGWITGSVEIYDLLGNLNLIQKIQPDVKQIMIISDETLSSQKCKKKVQEVESSFPAVKFTYLNEGLYMEDILEVVKELSPDSAVLFLSFFKDKKGNFYSPEFSSKIVSEKSPVPVYSAWDFYLCHGIIGGLITDSNSQGEIGAKIAIRILNGEKVSDIPITRESANNYFFDYSVLKRFSIKLHNLPKGSEIIGEPSSCYLINKSVCGISFIILLIFIIFILTFFTIKQKRFKKNVKKLHYITELLEKGNLNARIKIKSRDEIEQLADTFNRMASKIQEREQKMKELDKLKTDFLNITSHELKTPLTPIISYLDLLEDKSLGKLNQQQRYALNTIDRNIKRLKRLIDDVLDITKIETGRMKFFMENINFRKIIKDVVNSQKILAEKKKIKLITQMPKKLILIEGDKQRLTQVIINLLDNAIKFSHKKSNIILNVKEQNHNLIVFIKDQGIGLSGDELKNLFTKFFQVDTSAKREHPGTGLGLTICKCIIAAHNGKIWVESKLGKGSTFYFTLPSKQPKKYVKKKK